MRDRLLNLFFTSDITLFVETDRVRVHKQRTGVGARFSRALVQEFDYRSPDDLPRIFRQAKSIFNVQPSDRWFLGLPLKYFTLVNFFLPSAAQENLEDAVRFALTRHVPFDLEQSRINFHRREQDDYLDISAVIITRDSLKPFLHRASAEDITFHSVFPSILKLAMRNGDGLYLYQRGEYAEALVFQSGRVLMQTWAVDSSDSDHFLEETGRLLANLPESPRRLYVLQSRQDMDQLASRLNISPEETIRLKADNSQHIAPESRSQGYEIPLLPRTVIRRQAVVRYVLYGAVLFFGLSILALPFAKLAGQKRHLTKIENQVRKMRDNAEELTRLREESRQIMESIESMAEMRNSYPSVVNILRELTEAVPESAWIVSLRYSDRGLTIKGEAESSTSVIEALENSPLFREVRLSSPVTRAGSREKFTLEAEVVI